MTQQTHRKQGALEVTGDFQQLGILFAGATRPNQTQSLHVALHVRNNSADPIPFTFNTTQRFEIELADDKGAVVARWSQGKEFGQIVTTEPLPAHSTWTFDGELLVPRRAGQFTVRMYLIADKRPGAQSPLHVSDEP